MKPLLAQKSTVKHSYCQFEFFFFFFFDFLFCMLRGLLVDGFLHLSTFRGQGALSGIKIIQLAAIYKNTSKTKMIQMIVVGK